MGESTTPCNADTLAILRGVNELRAVDQGKYEKRRGNKCKGRGEREVINLLGGEVGWDGFVDVDAVRGQSRDWILVFGESWDELGLCCCEQVDVCTSAKLKIWAC